MRVRGAVMAAALLVAVAGCGSSEQAEDAAAGEDRAVEEAQDGEKNGEGEEADASDGADEGKSDAGDKGPCDLLSAEQLEEILGIPFSPGEDLQAGPVMQDCVWVESKGGQVSLGLFTDGMLPNISAAQHFDTLGVLEGEEEVDGVGLRAIADHEDGRFRVLVDGAFIAIFVDSIQGGKPHAREVAEAAAANF
ncbi:hypothetical protein PJ985_00990 [Streptomyces sp. ACA25]|uniref:hypothetical protein n=1 Tax=Streptomyces sp. ACA25 TaxID=3022596 RepID=UPI002307E9DD|nr:hypothetical protein [Streptomyces sp. ACA25]MDB1086153.1 hypothetical protein [Streptomyces sp. ACA25]